MKKKEKDDIQFLFNAWIVTPEVQKRIRDMFIDDLKKNKVVFKIK